MIGIVPIFGLSQPATPMPMWSLILMLGIWTVAGILAFYYARRK